MAINLKFKNSALTTLASDITFSQTTVEVTNALKLPEISAGEYYYAIISSSLTNFEIVRVIAVAGNTLSVVRAQESTTAKDFTAGDKFAARVTASQMSDIVNSINSHSHTFATITGKPSTLSGYGISDAAPSAHSHSLDARLYFFVNS